METTILELLGSKKLFVSRNSEGYNYEIGSDFEFGNKLIESIENIKVDSTTPKFDFGLLRCEKFKNRYEIIDGEQQLTLITIFAAAVFARLRKLRYFHISDLEMFEDILVRNGSYKFQTIPEDNLLLQNYITDSLEIKTLLKTESSKRIKKTFEFFESNLANKIEDELTLIIEYISEITIDFQIHKPISLRYPRLENNMLLDLFTDKEIAETLAYIVDFNEHKNLKTVAQNYHIRISNDRINIVVILYSGFEGKEYSELKNLQNLHLISFSDVVKAMHEFKNLPIKVIDLRLISTCMVARDSYKNFTKLNLLTKIN